MQRRARLHRGARAQAAAGARRGFTLIEVLVSLSVVAVLMSLLLPALGKGMARARAFRCQMNLRSVAFDFVLFADPQTRGAHGEDEALYGRNRFSLETFIESEYRIDEFWPKEEPRQIVTRTSESEQDSMRCPSVKGDVQARRATPCRAGAITPTQNVSFGFNSRLFRVESLDSRGRARVNEVTLMPDILTHGMVPLAWDIDGVAASATGSIPHFSAPALDSRGPYRGNRLWWPGLRHGGAGQFALIDGSVHSTADPLGQKSWRWAYQPHP